MKELLVILCIAVCIYADTPWFPDVRVSTDEPWDTLNQAESCFDVFGDTIVVICNTAERGRIPNAPCAYSFDRGQTFTSVPFSDTTTGWIRHTDPVLVIDDSGYVHVIIQFEAHLVRHYRSRDGGQTLLTMV
jgi:hypothetical protein